MIALTHKRVKVNDIRLHYVTAGKGPVVRCMHGLPHNDQTILPLTNPWIRERDSGHQSPIYPADPGNGAHYVPANSKGAFLAGFRDPGRPGGKFATWTARFPL